MDVYLIPIGRDQYELYCERLAPIAGEGEASGTWLGGLRQRFARMVRAAEDEQGGSTRPTEGGWWDRQQGRIVAWVAERVAEQRLLWNLRSESQTIVVHPEDMAFEQVRSRIDDMLRRDHDRHRRWMVIDGVAFVVTFVALGPLFLLIPGVANLPALYFGFRVVGHWFSMRGAAHGVHRVVWHGKANARLVDLRSAVTGEPRATPQEIREIADDLGLPKLAAFIESIAPR